MYIEVCSFASSSAGNSFLIKTPTTNLILDVGITMKRMDEALAEAGVSYEEIDGVFITHEHVDHIKGLHTLVRRRPFDGSIYTSEGTREGILDKKNGLRQEDFTVVAAGEAIQVGDITVGAFRLSHDAREPLGFTFSQGGKKVAVITDTGCITEEVFQNMRDADVLFLESNHERNVLLYGKYPYPLKTRILSDVGHLSNEATGDCLVRFLKERECGSGVALASGSASSSEPSSASGSASEQAAGISGTGRRTPPTVVLSHLSSENNTPKQAYITVCNMIEEAGFAVGKDLYLEVAPRSETGHMISV